MEKQDIVNDIKEFFDSLEKKENFEQKNAGDTFCLQSFSEYLDFEELAVNLLNGEEITADALREKLEEKGFFNVEVIYYGTAINFLKENDQSLRDSLELAHDMGFTLDNLNSETLASLLAGDMVRDSYGEVEDEINEFFAGIEIELGN